MKYKYTGAGSILVSSKGKLVSLRNDEEVEFDEKDISMQNLEDFVEVGEKVIKVKKTKKIDKEDE